jgi:ABC-type phosphate transport system substrate-binding protein
MAQTAPVLLGGGSSLVAPTIAIELAPPLFPATDGTASYWSVGSGAGQTAFLNNDATKFTSVVGGTTTTASGTVQFANSDAPLSPLQLSTYKTSTLAASGGPLIQLPYIVTPITIPLVNAPTGTGPAFANDTAHTPTVALNDADLCGIFSGAITDWSKVTNPDNNTTYAPGAIKVVYRTDGSGTTDLLTAHLAKVCPKPSGTTAVPVTFVETQTFASLFPSSTPPSNFVGASGSGGVAAQLVSFRTAGTAALGYLSPDFTNSFLATSTVAPAHTNQLAVASLRNTSLNADVLPTFTEATHAVGTAGAPSNLSDPSTWVPNASNPTTGYPISGTSQIILSQCYSKLNTPTVASSVIDFLNHHYHSNASLLNANGFDVVPGALLTAINNNILSNTSTPAQNLNIQNPGVCGKLAGR